MSGFLRFSFQVSCQVLVSNVVFSYQIRNLPDTIHDTFCKQILKNTNLRYFYLVEAAGIEPLVTYSKYVVFMHLFQVLFQVDSLRPQFSGTFRNIYYS